MIDIRIHQKWDFKKVTQFYKDNNYNNIPGRKNKILLALDENKIVWCVRICKEYHKTLLRWMWVTQEYQKQWIGTNLLQTFEKYVSNTDCFCLPYSHLENFYSQIGFKKIELQEAPWFLQKRLEKYKTTEKYPCIIMKKIWQKL